MDSSLNAMVNNLVEESGLNTAEVFRQALGLYKVAYDTTKSGGKVLLQDGKTYETIDVKFGR